MVGMIKKQLPESSPGRYLKGAALGRLGFCTSWAVDAHGHGKEWLEVVKIDLHLKKLPKPFHGKRIIHISDLHCGRTVSGKYLSHCVDRINKLNADMVVLTGDYVTYDYYDTFKKKIVGLMGGIKSRYGIYASLGNHDYGIGKNLKTRREKALMKMIEAMKDNGIKVLRNESTLIEIDGKPLWFVGLGDLWADDFEPDKAFRAVETDGTAIALSHNPQTFEHLQKFSAGAIMSGHTHGMRIGWRAANKKLIRNRHTFYAGMYKIAGKTLYVNRGLGRVGKMMFNTRPEITVYNLC